MLGEISQTEKDKYYMISLICGILKIQQTTEYNKKEADIENNLVMTSGGWEAIWRGEGRGAN